MGALGNIDHERFCQAAHRLIWAGEKRAPALAKAYREAMYRGDNADDEALKPNARRLANTKLVKARLQELASYSARLAGIDAHWAMLKLKAVVDDVDAYTLDHYMARDEDGERRNEFDLTQVDDAQMKRLTEITTETIITRAEDGSETVRRKIKLRGPDRYSVIPTVIGQMAKLGGWEAPRKTALTNPAGDKPFSLADMVNASMKPDMERAA